MSFTEVVPTIPLQDFKRTKMIVTLGPSTASYETVLKLIQAGANGLRLNFSHGTHEGHGQYITWIRRASQELGKPVAIIQDLQGPKVRLGDFDGTIVVQAGKKYSFQYHSDYLATGHIPTQYDLSAKVTKGERLYLFDGKVRTTVTRVDGDVVHVTAENDGTLVKRKGMNLPDTDFGGDIITGKDKADMAYGATTDIDYVAMSFVQTADDIERLRVMLAELGSGAKIISKIETKLAVDNLDAIVRASDAVMVARGDLAVETLAESVPIVQRQIIGLGLRYAKPTIVATQMLASMTDMPDPTRAEVSDVATAVIVGADCLMLSDETASGRYPVEAVQVMKRVIRYTEQHAPLKAVFPERPNDRSRQCAISTGVISLAESIAAKAIIAETKSGVTALQIACRRPDIPLIAVTSEVRTAQQLAIAYGVKSYVRPVDEQAAIKLATWLQEVKVLQKGDTVVTVSGQHPGVAGATDTIKIRVLA